MKKIDIRRVLALLLVASMLLTGAPSLIIAYAAAADYIGSAEDKNQTASTPSNQQVYNNEPVYGVQSETSLLYNPVATTGETGSATLSAHIRTTDNLATGAVLTTLTADGAYLENWEKNVGRYLHIGLSDLVGLEEGEYYQLEISMNPILYTPTNITQPWVTKLSKISNGTIPVNMGGTLALNEGSATYICNISPDKTDVSFPLQLLYDTRLWDQVAGSQLGYFKGIWEGTDLLSITLNKVSSGVATKVSSISLTGATAGSGGTITALEHSITYTDLNNTTATVYGGKTYRLYFDSIADFLCEDYRIVVTLPSYTDEETKQVYAFQFENGQHKFPATGGAANFTVKYTEEGGSPKAEFHLTDLYAEHRDFVGKASYGIAFTVPDITALEETGKQSFLFSGGKIELFLGDSTKPHASRSFTVFVENTKKANLILSPDNGSLSLYANRYVHFQAGFKIENKGGATTGPVTFYIRFDTNDTGAVGVTTFRIPLEKGATANVYFEMIDPATGQIHRCFSPLTVSSNNDVNGVLLYRSAQNVKTALPGSENYYFKSIWYATEVSNNKKLYAQSSGRNYSSSGNIWGLRLADTTEKTIQHQFTIYQGEVSVGDFDEATVLLTKTAKTTLVAETAASSSLAYGIAEKSLKLSDGTFQKEITAGESFTVTGRFQVARYPYTSRNVMDQLRIGILLPQGMAINQDGITVKRGSSKLPVSIYNLSYTEVDVNGHKENFWIIELDPSVEIGYFSEKLEAIDNGYYVDFSITVYTEYTVPTGLFDLCDRIYVAGKGQSAYNGGSYSNTARKDTYGLLGVDKSDANRYVGGVYRSQQETVLVNINAAPAQMDISDSFTVGSTVTTQTSYDQPIDYHLNISINEGGQSEDFIYFIPVPKQGNMDGLVTTPGLSYNLAGPASITHSDTSSKLKLQYTTAKGLTYDSAMAASVEWKDAGAIAADIAAGITAWSEVTLIKIVPEDPTKPIANGTEIQITATFQYAGSEEDYARNAGQEIHWNGKGYYCFLFGGNSNTGHAPTEGVTLILNYTAPVQHIALTAAKENTPLSAASINLNDLIGGNFVNQPTFTIQDITTVGALTLVGSSTDFSTMDSEASNSHFGITAKLNSTTASYLMAGCTVGNFTVPNTGEAIFSFAIFNGDVITENATEKKVTLNLVGSNGVTIPVEITILRVLTVALPGEPGIIGGKAYMPYTSSQISIEIAANSAFTAQFVTELIPANYICPVLSFGDNVTRRVILIDWSTSTPTYYWADVTTSASLDSFARIGGTGNYSYSTGTEQVTQRLLFIVEAATSSSTITLTQTGTAVETIVQCLSFHAVADRSFGLTGGGEIPIGGSFTLNYSTSSGATEANESFYQDRSLALVLTGTDLPEDLLLKVGGTIYSRNFYGEFIIPLGNIQNAGNGSISITAVSSSVNPACTMEARLYAAGASNGERPMGEDAVAEPVTITIVAPSAGPGFKVISMSDRVINKGDLGQNVTVRIQKANLSSTATVSMKVQAKEGNGYADRLAVLGLLTGLTAANGESTLTLRFSIAMDPGAYRLIFLVTDGDVVMEIPYNFVVVD